MRCLAGAAGATCLLGLVLAGCSASEEASPATPAPEVPATAAEVLSPEMQERADCAGAYAAVAGMDPRAREQDMSNPWVMAYGRMLSSMIDESPSSSLAGDAALSRADHWKSRPEAEQTARAEACRARFGG
jgi:hypothetical protein